MEDVFDLDEEDKQSELNIGSREWLRRVKEVHVAGEREGLFASRELLVQNNFNSGLERGFKLLNSINIIKGRLLMNSHLHPQNDSFVKDIIRSYKQIEQDIITQSSLPSFSHVHLEEVEARVAELLQKTSVEFMCI